MLYISATVLLTLYRNLSIRHSSPPECSIPEVRDYILPNPPWVAARLSVQYDPNAHCVPGPSGTRRFWRVMGPSPNPDQHSPVRAKGNFCNCPSQLGNLTRGKERCRERTELSRGLTVSKSEVRSHWSPGPQSHKFKEPN